MKNITKQNKKNVTKPQVQESQVILIMANKKKFTSEYIIMKLHSFIYKEILKALERKDRMPSKQQHIVSSLTSH
jgi:hypothetical protein